MKNKFIIVFLLFPLFFYPFRLFASELSIDKNDNDYGEIRTLFLKCASYEDTYRNNRSQNIDKLASFGKKAAKYMISKMNTKDVSKKIVMSEVFPLIGKESVDLLLKKMAVEPECRAFCTYILGKIGDARALIPIILLLDSDHSEVRGQAAHALGNLDSRLAVGPLIDALDDSICSVRRSAARSLGKLNDPRAIDPLIDLLDDSVYSVRFNASRALAAVNVPEIGKKLYEKLEEAQGLEKFIIMVTLGRLHYEPTIQYLTSALNASSHYIRGFACEALGYFKGNYKVSNSLKQALRDNSPFVQMKAENALERIQNKRKKSNPHRPMP